MIQDEFYYVCFSVRIEAMEKLVLIDGNAILHRAYHAYPPLSNSSGQLTNAVYGFSAMFLKILEDQKPDYIVVCFDRPKPTFRKQMYAGYQATRPQMADDLSSQISLVHDVLHKMNVQIFEVDGYEADDLIGTIASHFDKNGYEVIIVTGDRDMMQLVSPKVKVLMPIVGVTKTELYDEHKVEEKFGVTPQQIVDYKALVGDASDNYPGVAGIGPKGASNLIKTYGTLENIYEHLDEIKEKNAGLALKLASGAESAGMAKQLATIITDAPVTIDFKTCTVKGLDRTGLEEEFDRLEFKSLAKRIPLFVKRKSERKEEQLGLL